MLSFCEIEVNHAKLILDWRKSPRVSKFMCTEVRHGVQEQKKWIINSRKKTDFYHWLILYLKKPIGYLSLSKYNTFEKTASWGFYIGEEDNVRLGGLIPPYFYNFCFNSLDIHRIDAEMLYLNTTVIGLHLLHGYRFTPSYNRIITKNDKEMLLVTMSLYKEIFNRSRFTRCKSNFPTDFWDYGKQTDDTELLEYEKITGTSEQTEILHALLKQRKYKISHQQLPPFAQHAKFVKEHPYRSWWLIRTSGKPIGSVYFTNENSVGINLAIEKNFFYQKVIEWVRDQNIPLPPLPSVRPEFFFINVSPTNLILIETLNRMGSTPTQNSYRIG